MELITRSDTPVFLTVIALSTDGSPTFSFPPLTDEGLTEMFGEEPSPESFTVTIGFLGSSEEILRIALFLPKGITGANVRVIGQEPFAGIVEQLFI
jgi:hypothetical protein